MQTPETESTSELEFLSNRLAEMEAAQAAEESGQSPKPRVESPEASASEAADRAAAAAKGASAASSPDKGTPSAVGKTTDDKSTKPQDQKAAEEKAAAEAAATAAAAEAGKAKGSKYAQDKERRDNSWKALNDEKTAFKAEQDKLKLELQRERAALEADRQRIVQEKQQSRITPEAYDKWAESEKGKAAKLDAEAKKAEDAGEFDKAEKLKEAASLARAYEKLARQQAEEVRKNPPASDEQLEAKHQGHMKEWTLKAATDFPEFSKSNSPVQQEAVSFIKWASGQFPEVARMPGLVYFAAERAQFKTAADRVPGLEKELAEAKKKVVELEALTNPTPGGGAQQLPTERAWAEKSSEEQYAQLRAEAAAM